MIGTFGRITTRLVAGLGVAAAFAATTSATAPAQSAARGALDSSRAQDAETSSEERAVTDWSLIAQNTIVAVGRRFPGEAAVYMGIVHATIYDVVVAIEGGYRPYAITPTVPPNTSVDAAVAAATHRVLVERFRDQQSGLDDVYFAYLNGIPEGEAKTNGIEVGEEVGVGMLLLRANDGLDSIVPYVQRPPGPGVYEPTAPVAPLGTRMPGVLPLALENASQFRPNGPPALHRREYGHDFNEVKYLGRVDSSVRSAEQTAVALFWTDHDIPQWNRNLLRLADARGLTSIETARMLAMAHVAGGDAMIGCFDAKYHYLSWRPLDAIHHADTDGNPYTLPDPTWQPLLPTPNHPEYPSAHACHTTAIAEALESFFGPGRLRFSVDSLVTGETRYYKRFREVVAEVNNARVWAGFHFRYAQEDGSRLGRKVARFVVRNFFQPLD
jgi:PAP2 superfamily